MQIERLLEIILILLNKRKVTASELAEQFSVSTRTIYRDIDALSLAGIPVYSTKGRSGGIFLMDGYALDKSLLNDKEQKEILSALEGVAAVRYPDGLEVLEKVSRAFNKVTTNWIEIDYSDWGHHHGELFNLLRDAIINHRVVEYDYFNSEGVKTRRKAEPMKLYFKHRAWYLVAFCLEKQSERLFKLVRIKNLSVLEERFTPREPSEDPSFSTMTKAVRLKLWIDKAAAYRVYDEFDESHLKQDKEGNYLVDVTFPFTEWVYSFLLSFGGNLKVLEPEEVRVEMMQRGIKILDNYL